MSADPLRGKIAAVEEQMRAKLDEARATFAHAGDKGTSVEEAFRFFLRQYLPRRLELGHGEVVDRGERRSGQTDVVAVSEDHPLTFTPDLPGLFFIDAVVAAGEVKSILTSKELEKALVKSCDFKQLEMHVGTGTMIHANRSDRDRFYRCPPWFLMAFESQLTLDRIQAKIVEFEKARSVEVNRLADAVFILGEGWVINFGDGAGAFQLRYPDGTAQEGWAHQASDSVLFDFLGWLSLVMPKMLRFAPVLAPYLVASLPDEWKSSLKPPQGSAQ